MSGNASENLDLDYSTYISDEPYALDLNLDGALGASDFSAHGPAGEAQMTSMDAAMRSVLQSGSPRLDVVLGSGVSEGDVLLVVGPPGSGKTTPSASRCSPRSNTNEPRLRTKP